MDNCKTNENKTSNRYITDKIQCNSGDFVLIGGGNSPGKTNGIIEMVVNKSKKNSIKVIIITNKSNTEYDCLKSMQNTECEIINPNKEDREDQFLELFESIKSILKESSKRTETILLIEDISNCIRPTDKEIHEGLKNLKKISKDLNLQILATAQVFSVPLYLYEGKVLLYCGPNTFSILK